MARKAYPQCIGSSYVLDDTKAACQSAVNCYLEKLDAGNSCMVSAPGEVLFASTGGVIRQSKNIDGRWFVVSGNQLKEILGDGTYLERGSLLTSSGYVGMANNQTQLAIVDGGSLYIFDLKANTLNHITNSGWRGSKDVYQIDGYFVFVAPDSEQFYVSAIDDGTKLDALDFSSADSSPDKIIAHRVVNRQLVFFGSNSTEFWVNSGGNDFPFARYNSYTMDIGIVGANAAIKVSGSLIWVGKTDLGDGVVYMLSNNQPTRISTMAIEQMLRASSDISLATMWAYQIDGHEFVGINAPGLRSTLVYDIAMQEWHERAEWVDDKWTPLQSAFVTAYKGKHYACNSSGEITALDKNEHRINGRVLVRERTWPHIVSGDLQQISFYGLELSLKTGFGGLVTLEISNDGGENFGARLNRPLGVDGRRMQIVRWNQLGIAFNRVFRIRCSDNVPFIIYRAAVDT